jgi:hypothetical protein
MAIYSTGDGIKPQAQSGDPLWNKQAEEYFNRWAARCEVTNRFSFEECQSIICRAMDVDGEYFVHKTRGADGRPRLQLIESHRIGDLAGSAASHDGIGVDAFGAPTFYRTIEDGGGIRDLPADSVLHVFEPESATAIRHAPTLQHSINHIIDEMELLALEKHAVKDNADIARVLKTERGELDESGDFSLPSMASGPDGSDPTELQRIVGGKPWRLSRTNLWRAFSPTGRVRYSLDFSEHLHRNSALGVLPFEFAADSSKVGGAGCAAYRCQGGTQVCLPAVDSDFASFAACLGVCDWGCRCNGCPSGGGRLVESAVPEASPSNSGCLGVRRNKTARMWRLVSKRCPSRMQNWVWILRSKLRSWAQDARLLMDLAAKYSVPLDFLWHPSTGAIAPGAVVPEPANTKAGDQDN